jgi:DNA polymerase
MELKNIRVALKELKADLVEAEELGAEFILLPEETELRKLEAEVRNCTKCSISDTRNQVVFGTGKLPAKVVLVGEAPGAEEDIQGKPFVGRAGQLLTKMLSAIKLTRREVYITNILKCRPPQNRNPRREEILNCFPYLQKQLKLIKPKLILTLGNFATQTLLDTSESISHLRGKVYSYENLILIPTFHPASLLRNPEFKHQAWQDLQLVQKCLKE